MNAVQRSGSALASLASAALLASTAMAQTKPAVDPLADAAAPITSSSGQMAVKAKTDPAALPAMPDLNTLVDFSRVYFNTAADGSVSAVARDYKAQFTSAGVTYASRSGEVLTLALQSASVGGKSLAIQANAQPSLEGNSVSIDRGAFVEHYTFTAESLEQLFTIDSLPANGDLVIRIAATMPSMIATEKSAALEFAGQRGTVSYSKAVLVDNAQARTNLATQINDGVIEIRVPSSTLNNAQYPITIDPVISSGLAWGITNEFGDPDIAYDHSAGRYVMVCERNFSPTDGDIVSVLFDVNGVIVPNSVSFPDSTLTNWRNPSVANNNIANVFMVAAERGLAPTRGIWGNTINPATGATGNQFEMVNGANGEKTNPDIGGDSTLVPPTYFLVVWEWLAAPGDGDIVGALFNANGTVHGGSILLQLDADNQSNPAVSKSNGGVSWMVVWQDTYDPSDEDIYGAVVNWDGSIGQTTTTIDYTGVNHINPEVSSLQNTTRYLVAYEQVGAIALRLLDTDVGYLDGATLESLGDNPFNKPRYQPCVDTDGSKFIIGYSEKFGNDSTDWDFYASTLCPDGNELKLAEIHKNLDFSSWFDCQSSVACAWSAGGTTSSGALFGWTHETLSQDGYGTIHAGRYNGKNSCCPADISPPAGDGQITINDLLDVINQWQGATCTSCTADINGDQTVNIDDLLEVINNWGGCP